MKLNTILTNLIVFVIAIIVSFFFAEILLRLFTDTELFLPNNHPYYMYKSKPFGEFITGAVGEEKRYNITLNNYGFYDEHWGIKKTKDLRILVIGDSFTEGQIVPYDNHFTRLLKKKIQEKFDITVEVMSAGTSSWDTGTEIKFLEREGLQFKPDIVIIQFWPNDIKHNYLKGIFSLKDGVLVDNTPIKMPFPKRITLYFSSKSYVFRYIADFFILNNVANRVARFFKLSSIKYEKNEPCPDCNYFLKNPKIDYTKGYNITYKLLRRFKDLSQTNNFTPILLMIPMKEQVSNIYWSKLVKKYEKDADDLIQDYPNKKIINQTLDLHILDLYPTFKKKNYDDSLFFKKDVHTTSKGNNVIAESLMAFMIDKEILP